MKDGWKEVTDKDDTRVYESLLAQYSPSTELNECSFDMADPGDAVCLLWVQGEPAGFCTLKPKGCWIEELSEQYTMLTLDTIFVLPQYRQKGHVLSLLEELMRRQPGEDLGFSSPISSSMYAVLSRFLWSHPEYRTKLWEIQHGGGEGDRELIWYNMRRRNLIHTAGA
ncbi:soluble lamin-associated protein of 75 kDa-like isoform X2 [Diaphorina citri]|uniref:Soluble lamin-associated protein of 75 kDa-like isoform X1 n=1 Tax=Diaphorina citri TaxID=121845 RepID=A0A1S4E9N8_DIACI|nr:soluble lamin-associated protein of 75 kDa-like isoform X1 [Diaphorina citri]XP_026678124.1 soluble lamin-associated protein of 75 kDa-like isoform X2 [Diaphorina citri]KAI5725903.1 hypothetical protein M8J77_021524 [Diaphorina citri]